jgi:protein SCO1/2
MKSPKAIRVLIWAMVVALLLGAGTMLYWRQNGGGPNFAAAAIGGPFTLTDQRGATVTEAALKGHPSAVFFGYTSCPDVCPATLTDMGVWLKDLGPDGDRLKAYFVTVDPERDTQAQLAAYLGAFDPRITGLTGSRPAIDQMLKAYKVYSRKVPSDGGSYAMDHAAAVYLLDKDAVFTGTVDFQDTPEAALAKLKRLFGAG